jgi:hypothetical protein
VYSNTFRLLIQEIKKRNYSYLDSNYFYLNDRRIQEIPAGGRRGIVLDFNAAARHLFQVHTF